MAIKTYYYKVSGDAAVRLPPLLASGASPVVSLPSVDNPFVAITLDESNKADLDAAMAELGFAFVAEGVGKEKVITATDSPYTPGEELVVLADASAGPIVVTPPLLSTFATSIRQLKVVKTDGTANAVTFTPTAPNLVNGAASYALVNQYGAIEVVSGPSQWHLLLQPSAPAPIPGLSVTTSVTLQAGNIVAYDNSAPSQLVLADPSLALSPSRFNAKGIAQLTEPVPGVVTTIYSVPGQRVPVRFGVAPLAADNGKRVYLSTTAGLATLSAPGSGNALVLVGILVGGDGVTVTPDVVFEFEVIATVP